MKFQQPLCSTAPRHVYINVDPEGDPEEAVVFPLWEDRECVTWSDAPVGGQEVLYLRADAVVALLRTMSNGNGLTVQDALKGLLQV